MKNKNVFRYIAGVLFTLLALIDVVSVIDVLSHLNVYTNPNTLIMICVRNALSLAAYITLGCSCFKDKRSLLTIGGGFALTESIINTLFLLIENGFDLDLYTYISYTLTYVMWASVIISGLKTKFRDIALIVAAVAETINMLAYIIKYLYASYSISTIIVIVAISHIPFVIVFVMLYMYYKPEKVTDNSAVMYDEVQVMDRFPAQTQAPTPAVSIESQIDQIEKLNHLYSIGALTQEEFEAKKKQILGM